MKRLLLISLTVVLFTVSSRLRASYSYSVLWQGPGVTTMQGWNNVSYVGEIAATVSVLGIGSSADLEWGNYLFTMVQGYVTVQRCLSTGCVRLAYVSTNVHDGSAMRFVINNQYYANVIGIYVDNLLTVYVTSTVPNGSDITN